MNSFWPKGLEVSDTQSPIEILETAREEWEANSSGVLTLALQRTESQKNNAMIVVHAKHLPSNRTATLFSVIHRPNAPYPATIQPKDEDLPDSLMKSYYEPGIAQLDIPMGGRFVTNEWVSDTPAEFRDKLVEVFNLSSIKTAIFSLVSSDSSETLGGDEEPIEEEAPEEKKSPS